MKPPSGSTRGMTPSRYDPAINSTPNASSINSTGTGESPANDESPSYDGDSSLSSRSFGPIRSLELEPILPPFVPTLPLRPTILHLTSRNGHFPNIPPAVATSLVMGHTVSCYNDETPSSNDEDHPAEEGEQPPSLEPPDDEPPSLQPRDDDKDSLDDEDDVEPDKEAGVEKGKKWAHLSQKCKSYTWRQKWMAVIKIKAIQETKKLSQNKACE